MNPISLRALAFLTVAGLTTSGLVAIQDAKPDDRKWDVAAPTGPTTALAFDTTEGTLMNVDVSPDGSQVVFDLLGDIYMMPIAGSSGPARRLTSGPVFDMQPRFSPDGKRIAIASDRDGLWNIWTIDLDGKDAKQISRERRWFVNSPTWSPDGTYLYARRHFVKERSLGAGEIWMYHSSGASDGLQVTERVSWQKDAGEPDISPDGATLYYSKDVTPGQTFEYNKDPHGTIYAIIRRDLTTGRERRAVSVQGGSVTPQVSPDGKTLAYLRRVRLQSFLYLRDLEPVTTSSPRSRQTESSSSTTEHRCADDGVAGSRTRRDRTGQERQCDPDRSLARRAMDSVRGALQDLRRGVSANRATGRRWSRDGDLSGAARVAGRGLLPALVGRQPASLLGARA